MHTITYAASSHGTMSTRTIPWSISNYIVAEMEAVEGRISCSINPMPQDSATLIALLKFQLDSTDYQAIKFAEGQLSEEAYSTMRAQRAQWRLEINNLEEVGTSETV